VQTTVPGNRVITLAGQPNGTRSVNNSRSAPADSPIPVNLTIAAGQTLYFEATGAVDGAGPDGRTNCNEAVVAELGVARVEGACRSLVGMFLGDTTRVQPAGLNFIGDAKNLPLLRPLIQQPFLIGSGFTAEGERKGILVPAGATRLFLAATGPGTSTGSITVRVSVGRGVEIPGNPVRVSG